MSCEHLICAQCAGRVVEGRCPVCRAGREKLHHHGSQISPMLIALLVLLLFALVVLQQMHV